MSSRALRKLQKDQGLAHLAESLSTYSDDRDQQDESDEEPEHVTSSKPAKNLFDLVSGTLSFNALAVAIIFLSYSHHTTVR